MSLIPFNTHLEPSYNYTNLLITQCANNEPVDSETATEASNEAWGAKKLGANSSLEYLQAVDQSLQNQKNSKDPETMAKIFWQLASHTYKAEAKKKHGEDFIYYLDNAKDAVKETDSSKESLKNIKDLINKINEIKGNPQQVCPITTLLPDICSEILSYLDLKSSLLKNLTGISKQVDFLIQRCFINKTNKNEWDLPPCGFYSFKQTQWFGNQLHLLKHVSLKGNMKDSIQRKKYFTRKFQPNKDPFLGLGKRKQSDSEQIQSPHKRPRIEFEPMKIDERPFPLHQHRPPDLRQSSINESEQELLEKFIKSLKGITSFCFDQDFYSSEPEFSAILTPDVFLEFCKKNCGLEKLELISPKIKSEDLSRALKFLAKLKVLKIDSHDELTVVQNIPNPHTIISLEYPISEKEINALKKYSNLKHARLSLFKQFSEKQLLNKIIENLNKNKIETLHIEGDLVSPVNLISLTPQHFSSLPSSLKALSLKNQSIDLMSLLSAVANSTTLTELKLEDCNVLTNTLTSADFLDFCKKNCGLKKLELDSPIIKPEVLYLALELLTNLEVLKIFNDDGALAVLQHLQDLPVSQTIKSLEYIISEQGEIDALKKYSSLENATLSLFGNTPVKQYSNEIIKSLNESKIKTLIIEGFKNNNDISKQYLSTTLPSSLKILTLKNQDIDLQSLLSAAGNWPSLTELKLEDCYIHLSNDLSAYKHCMLSKLCFNASVLMPPASYPTIFTQQGSNPDLTYHPTTICNQLHKLNPNITIKCMDNKYDSMDLTIPSEMI